jgi:hypothetical protein
MHTACTIAAHPMSLFWPYTHLDRLKEASSDIGKVVRIIVFTRSDGDADQLALASSRAHSLLY